MEVLSDHAVAAQSGLSVGTLKMPKTAAWTDRISQFQLPGYEKTPGSPASLRRSAAGRLPIQSLTLTHTAGENTATASFRPPPQLELYFATHRVKSTDTASMKGLVLQGGGPALFDGVICRAATAIKGYQSERLDRRA